MASGSEATEDGGATGPAGPGPSATHAPSAYDEVVLADEPVAYWALDGAPQAEADLSNHGNAGTYQGGTPAQATMPNGDLASDFNGSSEYLTIPSTASMSIPTTGNLTVEGWMRPDVLEYPNSNSGYVAWMGKCASYAPTCEWEARVYSTTNPADRCNRWSMYAYNPGAGLGSGAYWQPTCGAVQAGDWYYVVGEYTLGSQPPACSNAATYPGSIDIWVNGVEWDEASHTPTGCMSQYSVAPEANDSPVNIGTMALDSWFKGAIGKVAIYDYLLTTSQIAGHYQAMTGTPPSGSCSATCAFE
jgi:hypothetical protein